MAAGVAVFVQMKSTFESLELTRESYYEANRFADVFASLKRAPSSLEGDVRRVPGVAQAETRVVFDVTLDVPGQVRPALGRLISIPADGRPTICGMVLREGRYVEPGHDDEVLASETFARANHLRPGDGVAAVINGRRRLLRIVGLALSPEYIYSIRPGEIVSDDALFGVFWMERKALATAFDMQGGFNDVVLRLMHGASARGVVSRLDRILAPYGGLGAQTRALQPSNFYLQGELDGLVGLGRAMPLIFLGVAAFLLNVVLTRIVSVERESIATLEALGYGTGAHRGALRGMGSRRGRGGKRGRRRRGGMAGGVHDAPVHLVLPLPAAALSAVARPRRRGRRREPDRGRSRGARRRPSRDVRAPRRGVAPGAARLLRRKPGGEGRRQALSLSRGPHGRPQPLTAPRARGAFHPGHRVRRRHPRGRRLQHRRDAGDDVRGVRPRPALGRDGVVRGAAVRGGSRRGATAARAS